MRRLLREARLVSPDPPMTWYPSTHFVAVTTGFLIANFYRSTLVCPLVSVRSGEVLALGKNRAPQADHTSSEERVISRNIWRHRAHKHGKVSKDEFYKALGPVIPSTILGA